MIDFSQSREQDAILEWADRHGPGRWLDIGAADGVTASNTRALADAGWGGVAVEPAARMFDALAGVYADRADVECVQAALVVEPSPLIRFHYSHDLVSTSVDRYAETWASLVTFTPCMVAAVTVDELFAALPGPYHFASIDTEGTTLELWEALRRHEGFTDVRFVVVEAEDGMERRLIQDACTDGWARIGVTPNNVILERL